MSEITWGLPVVVYLFLAGLGGGSFCLGAICSKRRGQGWEACSQMAFLLSPLAIILGLLMLIVDLRYKIRFWRTLTVLNVDSPMSIGVWLLSAFSLVSVLSAIFWLPSATRERIPWIGKWSMWASPKWRRRTALTGIPLALGICVYTGVLLSATANPLWRTPSLPLLFFVSAFSLGIEGGALLGLLSLRKRNSAAMKEPLLFLKRSYRVILPLYLSAALAFLLLLTISTASRAQALHLMSGWTGLIWWIGVVGIGIVLPTIHVMKKDKGEMRHAWLFSICLLTGDFLLRLVLVMAGQGAM